MNAIAVDLYPPNRSDIFWSTDDGSVLIAKLISVIIEKLERVVPRVKMLHPHNVFFTAELSRLKLFREIHDKVLSQK